MQQNSVNNLPIDKSKCKEINFKEWFFFLCVVLIGFALLLKTYHKPIQQNISVKVLQQQGHLENLHTSKNIRSSSHFNVDNIHFPHGNELYHNNTGSLGYKTDFFITLQTRFDVKKTTTLQFIIESDDGFQLKINNQVVCEFIQGREMQATRCNRIKLEQGIHELSLNYYQGFGQLGLIAKYVTCSLSNCNENDQLNNAFVIGNNSPLVTFLPMNFHNG
jgi:hypothetical protein